MADKKFTTMLQRNTNRITLILIYAVLEWILIAFLLLNSLFSYLIVKFADYFGLQKPCLWCSRLDHLFEPGKNRSRFQDLVCEAHSKEISNLGFCFNYRKLVGDMCDDCFGSSWSYNNKYSENFDIFPWLNQRRNVETCEKEKLSCCRRCCERLKTEIDPPFNIYQPSWEALDQTQMKNLDVDETIDELLDRDRSKNDGEKREIEMVSDFTEGFGKKEDISEETNTCSVYELGFKQNDCQEEENVEVLAEEDREFIENEKSRAVMDKKLEFSAQHLEFYIGQEDCQLIPIELTGYLPMQVGNNQEEGGEDNCGDVVLDFVQPVLETWHSSGEAIEVIPSHGSGVELNIAVLAERDLFEEEDNRFSEAQRGEDDSNHVHQDSKRDTDRESVEIKDQENEEEDKVLEKLLPLKRKESATEESFDGSVISDIDSYEGIVSIEKLKSALRADRMALNALYAELEEERSASAVAANQTMAMINRLQEDKASMQMEALQYQRMMEEQSEYDQEALHILNELVIKREREKQELEKELEVYRRRVHDFEAREKMRILRCKKEEISKSSSGFSSNGEESDEVLMEMNKERNDEDRIYENGECKKQNTPVNAVLYLEESLASFEEERISIIEQLKLLEEKLFFLSDAEENGNGFYENVDSNGRSNCYENGYHHREVNGGTNHQDRRIMNPKPKRLLPLFNKTVEGDSEEEEQELDKNGEGFELFSTNMTINSNNESEEYKKMAIEEEVDHVYERLQALEEDREFLKHCISSLKKGDKGLELLQEILQHLRDLRSVDIRVKGLNALSLTHFPAQESRLV